MLLRVVDGGTFERTREPRASGWPLSVIRALLPSGCTWVRSTYYARASFSRIASLFLKESPVWNLFPFLRVCGLFSSPPTNGGHRSFSLFFSCSAAALSSFHLCSGENRMFWRRPRVRSITGFSLLFKASVLLHHFSFYLLAWDVFLWVILRFACLTGFLISFYWGLSSQVLKKSKHLGNLQRMSLTI